MNLQLRPALTLFVALSIITGLAYPLAVTGLAQLAFPAAANGSLIVRNGQAVGSALIGQPFSDPANFWGRPSATADGPYNGKASGGSNLGPTSKKLRDRVAAELVRLRRENPEAAPLVPVELVTTSGSGLDPHLSPAGALWQVPRVARARGLAPERVRAVVERQIEERLFGLLGEPRVNVLQLNLALNLQFGRP